MTFKIKVVFFFFEGIQSQKVEHVCYNSKLLIALHSVSRALLRPTHSHTNGGDRHQRCAQPIGSNFGFRFLALEQTTRERDSVANQQTD